MKPIGNLAINYLGVKTEQFEVIERLPNKCYENGCTEARWLIQCKCGNKIEVPADNIRKRIENKITACRQCMQRSHQKYTDPSLVSAKQVIQFYKQSAKKRGLLYELSDEQFFLLCKSNCFYCGVEPIGSSNLYRRKNGKIQGRVSLIRADLATFIYNGIDRMDNSKGYHMDNCVPCCTMCNHAKLDYDLKSFKDWINRLILFHKKEVSNEKKYT